MCIHIIYVVYIICIQYLSLSLYIYMNREREIDT